jgi:oligopeptide transport system ATP-binding protein
MTAPEAQPAAPLLEVDRLRVVFPTRTGFFGRVHAEVHAVNDVSLRIDPGETLGLVGESGCGKSTLGRAMVRLVEPTSGSIRLSGRHLARLRGSDLRKARREVQMIFQDPFASLDPRFPIGRTIAEGLEIHRLAGDRASRTIRLEGLLKAVGLRPEHARRYPHEFSGGQRQRIGIARALAVEPRLIVCDEVVSALDLSVQAQILNLLKDLQAERSLAYLFIAHDLEVVGQLSHRIMVMYLGRIVEVAPARQLFQEPLHPYSRALLSAVPSLSPRPSNTRARLSGDVPSPVQIPAGCSFHPRCPIAEARCRAETPQLREVRPGHFAACHLA